MGAVFFYHLTRSPLEAVLPMLLEKSRANGWRVVVRGTDAKHLEWLDEKLWLGRDDDFLPHGLAQGDHDALQPILLTTSLEAANSPDVLITIGGADILDADIEKFERVSIIFDGNDENSLTRARQQWKAIVDGGASAQYWAQEDGRWTKKAER